ncbi:hypothetical protein R3W88_028242 [Solanum pinnatisectum]|uniref:Uncharacterized protein n=1 Tax=Solanum pinnatisectum TaxID=50273 RepID=A0AAV9LJ00_9SOLN|nr:hypothetical protein R3W88_028242 [Solanum pinnatisectum]
MQKFIWVLRDADRGDVFAGEERRARLPEGYEERIKGRGIIVRDWAPQHWACRDELVTSEIVENVVRTLMASPEGDDMRKKASELSNVVKQSVLYGGVNSTEMDSFIAHITR